VAKEKIEKICQIEPKIEGNKPAIGENFGKKLVNLIIFYSSH